MVDASLSSRLTIDEGCALDEAVIGERLRNSCRRSLGLGIALVYVSE